MRKVLVAACLLFSTPAFAASLVDCSGVISNGNQPITLIGPGAATTSFMLENIDSLESVWFSVTETAKAGGSGTFILPPAQPRAFATSNLFIAPPGLAPLAFLSVVAATVGHKISCTYW